MPCFQKLRSEHYFLVNQKSYPMALYYWLFTSLLCFESFIGEGSTASKWGVGFRILEDAARCNIFSSCFDRTIYANKLFCKSGDNKRVDTFKIQTVGNNTFYVIG